MIIDASNFGVVGDGTTDNTAALRWAVSHGDSIGGVVQLPRGVIGIRDSVESQESNVLIRGYGGDHYHDAGTGAKAATTLKMLQGGNPGAPMLTIRTPIGVGNSKRSGGGVQGVCFDGNQIAGEGVRIVSRSGGILHDIHYRNVTHAGLHMTCYPSGQIAETPDNRDWDIDRNSWRMLDYDTVWNAAGLHFSGDGLTGPNTCFSSVRNSGGQTWNRPGFFVENSDNVLFMNIKAQALGILNTPTPHPLAYGLYFGPWEGHKVFGVSGNIKIAGIASGYPANSRTNMLMGIDAGNGSTLTMDEGCDCTRFFDNGYGKVIAPPDHLGGVAVKGWSEGNGTPNKGPFNADFRLIAPATYNQGDLQTTNDHLLAARQRILALEGAMRARGWIE